MSFFVSSPFDDEDVFIEIACDQCGTVALCEWTCNPFISEIYPERDNPNAWWCKECHYEARMDIQLIKFGWNSAKDTTRWRISLTHGMSSVSVSYV